MNDNERHTGDILERTRAELAALKTELERARLRHKDEHDIMSTENEELNKKITQLKYDKVTASQPQSTLIEFCFSQRCSRSFYSHIQNR